MIKINLLPVAERPSLIPVTRIITAMTAGTLALCAMLFFYHAGWLWHLEQQVADAKNQHELLRPVENNRTEVNTRLGRISQREIILAELTKERKPWNALITHLAEITPPQVWFTHVGLDDKEKEKHIKIVGIADKYTDLASLISRLESDDVFANPVLATGERKTEQIVPSTRFEITVQLKESKP